MKITDLNIYMSSLLLAKNCESFSVKLQRNLFDVKLQLLRSSRSISANIAEGFAKKSSQKEFVRYLNIALGSSDEVVHHLRYIAISQFNNLDIVELKEAADKYKILSKQINYLIQTIIRNQ